MKQQVSVIALMLFIAGVSFVLSAQVQQQGQPIAITLAGPGAPAATLILNREKNQVCYELTADKAGIPTAVNIQSAGTVVISLRTPCATVEREKIEAILGEPANYYINVQN